MMRSAFIFFIFAAVSLAESPKSKSRTYPIIDVHLHAHGANEFGKLGLRACPGDTRKKFPAIDPRTTPMIDALEDCPNPIFAPKTDAEVLRQTQAQLTSYNIMGVISGPIENIQSWQKAFGGRMIPALQFEDPQLLDLQHVRQLVESGQVRVLGEIGTQYSDIAPNDHRLDAYYSLAQELDVPVGIHIGPGPPGAVRIWGLNGYRSNLSSPLLLESVLLKYPRLRLYVMHAGWPFVDAMIQMLYAHPQLHVDLGVINWFLPRREFHSYLRRLVEAGFEDRIMFGSDQMIWPDAIRIAVEAVESAGFLTPVQKRAIFNDNARRFLRIETSPSALGIPGKPSGRLQ